MRRRSFKRGLIGAVLIGAVLVVAAPLWGAERNAYTVTNLVSNGPVPAKFTDTDLKNAWGLVAGPTTPFWVADNGTNMSTLYAGDGTKNPNVHPTVDGGPTGVVFNGTNGAFLLPSGATARFIFASEDGHIRGWTGGLTAAVITASGSSGAKYKGLAIDSTPGHLRLYATDFHNAQVDVWDGAWTLVSTSSTFVDPSIPAGYAPFGIQKIGDRIFVTYAKQDEEASDDVHGQGLGFVDAFDTDGNLLARVAQHGQLNAPWGLAWAPDTFGRFGGDLLVGNFGNGEINAYAELANGQFEQRGRLSAGDGAPLAIDGLWALQFGNGLATAPTGRLFFTAGPNDEADGLFGSIDAG
jgi:uncharacterized protein (TIGR03118 family)